MLFIFRFGVNLENFPTIKRINEALLTVPAIMKSHPDRQPDAQLNL